jgi:hypothetical protein
VLIPELNHADLQDCAPDDLKTLFWQKKNKNDGENKTGGN